MLKLVDQGALTLHRAIALLSSGPARCLGQQIGHLEIGRNASLCVVDAAAMRTPIDDWLSAGKNSPWLDAELPGNVRLTVCEGRVTWLSD
jgi:dihydroorotase